jgi:hypothetical protein
VVETKEKSIHEPALISPTNSVDEQVVAGSSENPVSSVADKDESVRNERVTPTNESTETDSNATCNQPRSVSPSPMERGTVRKSFFHRSYKNRPAKAVASANTKKALLHLDDDSVDATEGSHDYTSTSETVPGSESTSATSTLSCDANLARDPPKSLSCDTTGNVSPLFATGSSTKVLDDKVFRSLALPSFVEPSPRDEDVEIFSVLSPMCPPELAEIAEIYEEIGHLHEC